MEEEEEEEEEEENPCAACLVSVDRWVGGWVGG